MSPVLVNIGCGDESLAGYINLDREPSRAAPTQSDSRRNLQADICQGLPFATNTLDGLYSEHFIEHLSQRDGLAFLRECRRAVKPGAWIRLATPDLDLLVQDYARDKWTHTNWEKYGYEWIENGCEMLNLAMRDWGHLWVYNETELTRLLTLAGFDTIRRVRRSQSAISHFGQLEHRQGSQLVLEAQCPISSTADNPLVTIIIPAYRSDFFDACLESAINQSYPNTEIIVCDDSPDNEIEERVARSAAKNIRYIGRENTTKSVSLGAKDNQLRGLALATGTYIKYLCDDDLLHPECISRMVACLEHHPEVTLITSHRQRIDTQGTPLPDQGCTKRPVAQDAWIEGRSLANVMFAKETNLIGEPTSVLFRRRDITGLEPHCMALAGTHTVSNCDVNLWANLLSRGHAIYLVDTLSYFRIHPGQEQRQQGHDEVGRHSWNRQKRAAKRIGLYDPAWPKRLIRANLYPKPWWPERVRSLTKRSLDAAKRGDSWTAHKLLELAQRARA